MKPSVSVYSSAWNALKYSFDYKNALDNWASFASEICVAVGTSEDDTYGALDSYAKERGYPVKLILTSFDMKADPYAYGKTENAALQACTGQILCQQNLDERTRVDPARIEELYTYLVAHPEVEAFFVPTIDLYGSYDRACVISRKWYWHRPGLFRGAVNFGIKPDGRPSYEKTSTDELIHADGTLANTVSLLQDLSIESVRSYVSQGWPLTYHLGYFDLKSRADRAAWWKTYWETATGGDPNTHITDVAELEKRHTFEHGLPMWPTLS